jgi:crossover junction endodeoxyribonuclease RusA
MTDTLFVPFPAGAQWLGMNDRLHFQQRARHTKRWRAAAAQAAEDHPKAYPWTVDILAEIHKPPGRNVRWDSHNLAPTTKAIIDGLVDAHVLTDDNTRCVYWVATVDGGRRDTPGVTITITPTRKEAP